MLFCQTGKIRVKGNNRDKENIMSYVLSIYPNLSESKRLLLPITECRPRSAMDNFINEVIWETVMITIIFCECEVYLYVMIATEIK
jgi:hypothetical protein